MAKRNLHWNKILQKLNKGQVTLPFIRSLHIQDGSCPPERLPEGLARLNKLHDEVKTFIMFLGYSQPIDSLTGAILDAHPEILIPQQYDVLGNWKMFQDKHLQQLGQQKYMLFFHLQYLSTFQALFRNQASKPSQFWLWTFKDDGVYYNFVPGAWQGNTNGKLKVIGDSSGFVTSKKLHENHGNFSILEEIQTVIGIPVKFIHIIANPFDSIASIAMRRFDSTIKINDTKAVNGAIKTFFALVDTNEELRKIYGNSVLDIFSQDLMLKPKDALRKICMFLDVECDDKYLETVGNVLSEVQPSRTRDFVEWKMEDKDWIRTEMKKFAFLQSFSFDSN